MAPFVKKIVDAGVRVLLYYGDTDMACNFMMGQQFAANLGFRVLCSTANFVSDIKKLPESRQTPHYIKVTGFQ